VISEGARLSLATVSFAASSGAVSGRWRLAGPRDLWPPAALQFLPRCPPYGCSSALATGHLRGFHDAAHMPWSVRHCGSGRGCYVWQPDHDHDHVQTELNTHQGSNEPNSGEDSCVPLSSWGGLS
jgi:hypothetical protein